LSDFHHIESTSLGKEFDKMDKKWLEKARKFLVNNKRHRNPLEDSEKIVV